MTRGLCVAPLPPAPTRSRPHWNSSQHSLRRRTRAPRGPSFPPACARRRACPSQAPPVGGAPPQGQSSPPLPSPATCCPSARKAQPLFSEAPLMGTARPPARPPCSPCSTPSTLCLHLLQREPFPPPSLFQPKPPFGKGSLSLPKRRLRPPRGVNPAVSWEGPLLSGWTGVGEVGPKAIGLLRCEGQA